MTTTTINVDTLRSIATEYGLRELGVSGGKYLAFGKQLPGGRELSVIITLSNGNVESQTRHQYPSTTGHLITAIAYDDRSAALWRSAMESAVQFARQA